MQTILKLTGENKISQDEAEMILEFLRRAEPESDGSTLKAAILHLGSALSEARQTDFERYRKNLILRLKTTQKTTRRNET